eukprot:12883274-Prorocentrum_lima.AAC.1
MSDCNSCAPLADHQPDEWPDPGPEWPTQSTQRPGTVSANSSPDHTKQACKHVWNVGQEDVPLQAQDDCLRYTPVLGKKMKRTIAKQAAAAK